MRSACTLPGADVAALLTSADTLEDGRGNVRDRQPRPVSCAEWSSPDRSSAPSANSTYTLILANYGENVTITPPPSIG